MSGNDSFGALIEGTPADTSNDRATSPAQQQSTTQRRSDDASAAAADNARSRDAAAADQAARKNSDDRDTTAKRLSDASADSNANADADAVQRPRAKKVGVPESAEKSSSEQTPAADSSTIAAVSAQQGGPTVTTPNMVAVVIPVTIAPADIPAATPAAGNATAPLAIAAAAIAASSPATSASAASSAQINIDATASAAAIASVSSAQTGSDVAATAKIAVQAAATAALATPVKQQASQTVATAVTDVALATAVAATAPVAPKTTPLKAPVAAPTKSAASDAPDIAPGTPDPSARATPAEAVLNNVAQQPAVAAKPEARNGIVEAAKADASATSSSTSAAIMASHEHSLVTTAAHTLTDSSDAGVQIQPQLPTVAATAALAGPLGVTPATNAPVPLSGLALEIAVSARSGKSRFEIRLDPADLGRIDVRIDVDRNGQVTSHLTVEKPETLSMLRQDAPQLQRQLDDAGFKTGNGGLQFSLRDQSSSGQNNGNETGRNAQRLVISDEDTIPAAVAGRTYGRMLGSSSGVDIRV